MEAIEAALARDRVTFDPSGRKPQELGFREGVKLLARSPHYWMICAAFFFISGIYYTNFSWLPGYLVKERGYTALGSGMALSLPYAAAALGALLSGYLADRLGRRTPVLIAFAALTIPGIVGLLARRPAAARDRDAVPDALLQRRRDRAVHGPDLRPDAGAGRRRRDRRAGRHLRQPGRARRPARDGLLVRPHRLVRERIRRHGRRPRRSRSGSVAAASSRHEHPRSPRTSRRAAATGRRREAAKQMQFEGKVAIVTGGAGRIGLATARAARRARRACPDRGPGPRRGCGRGELARAVHDVRFVRCRRRRRAGRRRDGSRGRRALGPARRHGGQRRHRRRAEPPTNWHLDDWQRALDVNLTSVLLCIRYAVEAMQGHARCHREHGLRDGPRRAPQGAVGVRGDQGRRRQPHARRGDRLCAAQASASTPSAPGTSSRRPSVGRRRGTGGRCARPDRALPAGATRPDRTRSPAPSRSSRPTKPPSSPAPAWSSTGATRPND